MDAVEKRLHKRLERVRALLGKGRFTARELARRLGVSQPTVYSTLRALPSKLNKEGYRGRLRGEPENTCSPGPRPTIYWIS